MNLSRRDFMAGVASMSLAVQTAAQNRAVPIVRRDLSTPEGQADLIKYARAVRLMMQLPASDPRSWTFQWYVHEVRGDRTKAQELKSLFPVQNDAAALAAATWGTCQAHRAGSNPDDFLPWHRMYLMCFETTIRSLLNDPSFALPYWNYLAPGQRALPAAFLDPAHVEFGPLHRVWRRTVVNQGMAIDANSGGQLVIDASSLGETSYRPLGARQGFCREVDNKLHGNVHVGVGNGNGMGSVPWAANDPIFWVHHANIDRLWASWNVLGGRNPQDQAWIGRSFMFPNGTGGRAQMKSGQVSSLQSAGYGYDRLEVGQPILAAAAEPVERPSVVLGTLDTPLTIGPAGAHVLLRRTGSRPPVAAAATSRTFLLVSGLMAAATPGTLYRVELETAKGQWSPIGYVNFFNAVHGDHTGHMEGAGRIFSFDVTDLLARTKGAPNVRVMPLDRPEADLAVTIGRIDLVQN